MTKEVPRGTNVEFLMERLEASPEFFDSEGKEVGVTVKYERNLPWFGLVLFYMTGALILTFVVALPILGGDDSVMALAIFLPFILFLIKWAYRLISFKGLRVFDDWLVYKGRKYEVELIEVMETYDSKSLVLYYKNEKLLTLWCKTAFGPLINLPPDFLYDFLKDHKVEYWKAK